MLPVNTRVLCAWSNVHIPGTVVATTGNVHTVRWDSGCITDHYDHELFTYRVD